MTQPRALLITGTVGSGKTTVLLAAGELLRERGAPYALVDLDWLAWVSPAAESGLSVHDVLVANVRAVWPTFAAAGVTHVVLSRHVRDTAEAESIRGAVAGELAVVRLDAPRQVLEARLQARDHGSDLVEHLAEIRAGSAELACPVVVNADRTAADVAREVIAAAGW